MSKLLRRWYIKLRNNAMKNITINFPVRYDVQIGKLIKSGLYPSRSEVVRVAIRDLLLKDFEFLKQLNMGINQETLEKELEEIKRKSKIRTIFIPKAKRKEVEKILLKLNIIS